MSLKRTIKTALLGQPGERVRIIKLGLLRGMQFPVDTAEMSMRLVGLWETEIMWAVRRAAGRAVVACDIGANSGWYSLYFASRPNIERNFAFEPDTAFGPVMRLNLERNNPAFLQKITLINKFVGDRGDDEQWCRLDTVLRDVNKPILLKIDIDGGELDAIRGARETLQSKRCELIIETHSPELEDGCAAFLRQLGYRVRIIKNGWYRVVVPEGRTILHNRWLTARR